jgi:DNA modification methylase
MVAGFTAQNTIVMDPFMGSGTTAISSITHKRKFIGFELKEEYCRLAKNRVVEYRKNQMERSCELVLWS